MRSTSALSLYRGVFQKLPKRIQLLLGYQAVFVQTKGLTGKIVRSNIFISGVNRLSRTPNKSIFSQMEAYLCR
jgi:hypothetical protein